MTSLPNGQKHFKRSGEWRTNSSFLYGSNYVVFGSHNTVRGENITVYGNFTRGNGCKKCRFIGDHVFCDSRTNFVRGCNPVVVHPGNVVETNQPEHVCEGNEIREISTEPRESGTTLLRTLAVNKYELPEATASDMLDEQVMRYVEGKLDWPLGTFNSLAEPSSTTVASEFVIAPPMEEEQIEAAEEHQCQFCYSNAATCAVIHKMTAHLILCNSCAQRLGAKDIPKTCPLCREPMEKIVQVYGSMKFK